LKGLVTLAHHAGRLAVTINQMKSMDYTEEIPISNFKRISIQFPGDVYFLALLITKSDQAKSTSNIQSHTTLTGFANKVESTYGIEFSKSHCSDSVMSIFRKHGIKGNPRLVMEEKDEQLLSVLFNE
jgi:hypothetical protein